jgi:hypothetical protein
VINSAIRISVGWKDIRMQMTPQRFAVSIFAAESRRYKFRAARNMPVDSHKARPHLFCDVQRIHEQRQRV